MKAIAIVLSLVLGSVGLGDMARAATYYVAASGSSDQNNGTQASPWATLGHAADVATAGDTVIVQDGSYNEVVSLSTGGTGDGARVTFRAENLHQAVVLGFVITGDWVTVEGFDIEADTTNWRGIYVNGAHHVELLDNYVHECPMGGIVVTYGASYAEVVGNVLHHNGQLGIELVGSYGLVEDNEISESVQHHPKGEEAGFSGHDADGMRIFGDHHVIRGNFIHDIANPNDPDNSTVSGQMPHADCLQTWNASRPVMTDTLIEGNHCRVHHLSGKGIMMDTDADVACHHITIRNNLFEFRDIGIAAQDGLFEDIYIYNNTFKNDLGEASWGCPVLLENVTRYAFQNNITVDAYMHRSIEGGSGVVSHNLLWNSDGSVLRATPGEQADEQWGVDPLFAVFDWIPGAPWEQLDYHLLEGSPAVDVGITLAEVTDDFDGVARPQEGGYDLGAFEYLSGSCIPRTCSEAGFACGDWSDGCGGMLACGSCGAGEICNASGQCAVDCGDSCPPDAGPVDATPTDSSGGCGCHASPRPAPVLCVALALLWWVRRRLSYPRG